MAPQLLGDPARLLEAARVVWRLALGAVPQKQQPALLLGDVVLPRLVGVWVAGRRMKTARGICEKQRVMRLGSRVQGFCCCLGAERMHGRPPECFAPRGSTVQEFAIYITDT